MIPQTLVSTQKKNTEPETKPTPSLVYSFKMFLHKGFHHVFFSARLYRKLHNKSQSFSVFPFSAVVVEEFSRRSYFTSTSSLLSFYMNSIAKVTSVRKGSTRVVLLAAAVQCPCLSNLTKLEYILLAQFVQQNLKLQFIEPNSVYLGPIRWSWNSSFSCSICLKQRPKPKEWFIRPIRLRTGVSII